MRGELKMMRLPSGVQPSARSGEGCQVSLFGTPPAAGTTKTSTLPSYSPVKAMSLPSGENTGSVSVPAPLVRRAASPPSRGTLHKSPAYAKTMWVLLRVGFCSSSGASAAPASAAVASARSTSGLRMVGLSCSIQDISKVTTAFPQTLRSARAFMAAGSSSRGHRKPTSGRILPASHNLTSRAWVAAEYSWFAST